MLEDWSFIFIIYLSLLLTFEINTSCAVSLIFFISEIIEASHWSLSLSLRRQQEKIMRFGRGSVNVSEQWQLKQQAVR